MDKGFITIITQEEDGSITKKRVKYQEGMKVRDLVDGEHHTMYAPMKSKNLSDLLDYMQSQNLEKIEFISKSGDKIERYQIKKL
jgi:hypothetical protein